MPRLTMYLLIAVVVMGSGARVAGQAHPGLHRDSSVVHVRRPAADALQAYRENPAFRYEQAEGPSWWDDFWRWLGDVLLVELDGPPANVQRWVLYVLAAVALVYAMIQLLQMDLGGAFSRRSAVSTEPPAFEKLEEHLHQVDFEPLIEAAAQAGAYRRAVRLLYLKTLKGLAADDRIRWQLGKTNWVYVEELRPEALHAPFARLTVLFERVWYGDGRVQAATFARIREHFAQFQRGL